MGSMKNIYYTKEILELEKYPEHNAGFIEFLKESNAIEGIYDKEMLDQSMVAWLYLIKQPVITVSVILKTHKLLMLRSNLQPNQKGYFRDENVRVGLHHPPDSHEVPMLMQNWCFESMRAFPPVDPIDAHVDFENIHPFIDGNGRIGRMLMNWMFLKRSEDPRIIVIEEKDRQEYYKWFRK